MAYKREYGPEDFENLIKEIKDIATPLEEILASLKQSNRESVVLMLHTVENTLISRMNEGIRRACKDAELQIEGPSKSAV